MKKKYSYICRKLKKGEKIKIDGKLDEKAWQNIEDVAEFEFPWPKKGDWKQPTACKLCWDDNYLYLGYFAYDRDIRFKNRGRKGKVWLDDVVEIFLDPTPNDKDYFGFELNARGDLLEYKASEYRKFDYKWVSKNTKTAVHRVKNMFFTAEFAISFKDLGIKPKDGSRWKMGLFRCDYNKGRKMEAPVWKSTETKHPDYHWLTGFGWLIFRK